MSPAEILRYPFCWLLLDGEPRLCRVEEVRGQWAAHRTTQRGPDLPGWSVTYLPTGQLAAHYHGRAEALAGLRVLDRDLDGWVPEAPGARGTLLRAVDRSGGIRIDRRQG